MSATTPHPATGEPVAVAHAVAGHTYAVWALYGTTWRRVGLSALTFPADAVSEWHDAAKAVGRVSRMWATPIEHGG